MRNGRRLADSDKAVRSRNPGIKISELSRRTGVSKQTIHFYTREGLLPPPIKTAPSMAYYDKSHIDALKRIKRLQERNRLRLSEIKNGLDQERDLFKDAPRLAEALSHDQFPGERYTAGELARESGLSLKEIRELSDRQVLSSMRSGHKAGYPFSDLAIARSYRALLAAGYSPDQLLGLLDLYMKSSKELAREELKAFLSLPKEGADTGEMSAIYKEAEPHLERCLWFLHRKELVRELGETLKDIGLQAAEVEREYKEKVTHLYLSPKYFKKVGIDTLISQIESNIEESPSELGNHLALQSIYYAMGDAQSLLHWSERAAEVDPTDRLVTFFLAAGYTLRFEIDRALEVLHQCLVLHPEFAMAHCALGVNMWFKAASETTVASALALLWGAQHELDAAAEKETGNVVESLLIHVARGRVLCLLPDFMGRFEEGVAELERALRLAENQKEKLADPYSRSAIDQALLNLYFFVGDAYSMQGRLRERNSAWKKAISIDPDNDIVDVIVRETGTTKAKGKAGW